MSNNCQIRTDNKVLEVFFIVFVIKRLIKNLPNKKTIKYSPECPPLIKEGKQHRPDSKLARTQGYNYKLCS